MTTSVHTRKLVLETLGNETGQLTPHQTASEGDDMPAFERAALICLYYIGCAIMNLSERLERAAAGIGRYGLQRVNRRG